MAQQPVEVSSTRFSEEDVPGSKSLPYQIGEIGSFSFADFLPELEKSGAVDIHEYGIEPNEVALPGRMEEKLRKIAPIGVEDSLARFDILIEPAGGFGQRGIAVLGKVSLGNKDALEPKTSHQEQQQDRHGAAGETVSYEPLPALFKFDELGRCGCRKEEREWNEVFDKPYREQTEP